MAVSRGCGDERGLRFHKSNQRKGGYGSMTAQRSKDFTIIGAAMNKVITPDMIAILRTQPNA
jgi:hypothetical protein